MKEYQTHYLYPGALHCTKEPYRVTTILGTCVAVCLWDPALKIGGINHYLLPLWNGEGLASPKYGNIAIERLLEKMIDHGSSVNNIVAKVFGGKEDPESPTVYNIGQRNIDLAMRMLQESKIDILSQSVGGPRGRKLMFHSDTGEVLMKYIEGK